MSSLKEKILCEIDNIDKVIENIKNAKPMKDLNNLEVMGISALIQNFYSGIENILKQIFNEYNYIIPNNPTWHKSLLTDSVKYHILSESISLKLNNYLGFRHFFIHGYGYNIKKEFLKPLVDDIFYIYEDFKKEISKYL